MTKRMMHSHTLLLSLLHFLVDGICACALMLMSHQIVSSVEAGGIIILYDVLAFGTQPWTGRWVDRCRSQSTVGANASQLQKLLTACSPRGLKLSMALLAGGAVVSSLIAGICNFQSSIFNLQSSYVLTILMALSGAILLGMGNSLFHVYGGRYVAVASRTDIRAMGIFVSTGAVGLAIGLGFSSLVLLTVFLIVFLALSSLHLRLAYGKDDKGDMQSLCPLKPVPIGTAPKQAPEPFTRTLPALYLFCLMFVVAGRAFIGENVPSLHTSIASMSAPMMMVAVSVIVMAGKAAGGFLSKWWGVRNVFFISMLLSGVLFLMCPWHNVFVLATLFLINLSMPCTLYLATKAVPGREGWTFGLLAMALLPGYLLGTLTKGDVICQTLLEPLVATIVLESLLLLFMRERRWQVLAASVLLNILTNVPLNAFVIAYGVTAPLHLVGLECVVIAVEFIGYWLVLRNRRRAFNYSLLCNTFSALAGYIFLTLCNFLCW